MKVKLNKKIIPIIIISIVLLTIFIIPFKNNKSIFFTLINNKYEGLSAERQALYDKMRIEYVNIKSNEFL